MEYEKIESLKPLVNYTKGEGRNMQYLIPSWLISKEITFGRYNQYKSELGKNLWVNTHSVNNAIQIFYKDTFNADFNFQLYPGGGNQFYYDRLIKAWSSISQRPRCNYCNRELVFKNISLGYGSSCSNVDYIFCSKSCSAKFQFEHPELYPDSAEHYHEFIYNNQFANSFGVSGTYYSEKLEKYINYKSNLELSALKYLDSDINVVDYIYEPDIPELEYIDLSGVTRLYIVDFLVTYKDGSVYLIEVKPSSRLRDSEVILKAEVARLYADKKGWLFEFWTENDL